MRDIGIGAGSVVSNINRHRAGTYRVADHRHVLSCLVTLSTYLDPDAIQEGRGSKHVPA